MEKKGFISEWLLTNRLGGYALGSEDLINRRKYHGLLISSDESLRRIHLVSSVEEKFGVCDTFLFLDSNIYHDTIYPDGFKHIVKYRLRPYPAVMYSLKIGRKNILLLKEILMAERRNTTLLRYENLGRTLLDFSLRYKFSLRNHHHVNNPGTFDHVPIRSDTVANGKGGWAQRADTDSFAFVYCISGEFLNEPIVFRNILYPWERERGYDWVEDVYSPFVHRGVLKPGESIDVIFTDQALEEPVKRFTILLKEKIVDRNEKHPLPKDHPSRALMMKNPRLFLSSLNLTDTMLSVEEYRELLELLLDDFRTKKDLVAGFPWFSAWGRDSMIALEAYIVRGKDTDFVYSLLEAYGERAQNGLVPNVIGEDGKGTNFDTIDASLWYVIRVYQCFEKLNHLRQKRLFEFCVSILLNYIFNETLPFFFDQDDCLLSIRDGVQSALTWMDAKVEGWPVTPRYGKPVEINALWYNSVQSISEMAKRLGRERVAAPPYRLRTRELSDYAQKIKKSMGKFYANGIWYDRIERGVLIEEIRPNFVIACSLPFDIADRERLEVAARLAREQLLTPFGLRSLSRSSPLFMKYYEGGQKQRDRAYHQGTVWAWLLLPYAHLLRKITPDKRLLNKRLLESIGSIRKRVVDGAFASVAEVWDGEAPDAPKGTPAQAWSVAALFCIEKMITDIE